MSHSHATPQNISTLVRLLPHMPSSVAEAWLRCEAQAVNNPTNPLNILYYGRANQIGKSGRFAVYRSSYAGLADAARLIKTLPYYTHVRAALATGNAAQIAYAIERSPWAGGNYGSTISHGGCISRGIANTPIAPIVAPPHPTYLSYKIERGDTLSDIASRFSTTWRVIYSLNRSVIGSDPNVIIPGTVIHIPLS